MRDLGGVRVLQPAHQVVVSSLPPTGNTVHCIIQQHNTQNLARHSNWVCLISLPGTVGQAWYCRESLVCWVQVWSQLAGEPQLPRPQS